MGTRNQPRPSKITNNLLRWYRRSRRDLPWRRTSDPYAIWVSEVMLQQTQVATVIPYYERFLARFPSLQALAAAPLDDVLKQWEGLGYYARARNLHRAAVAVVTEHGGMVPRDAAAFRRLPGVGEYIGAAVPSIAFDAPLAVVDGNVKRVIARLFRVAVSVDRPAGARVIAAHANALLDAASPGDFNQAMMELGALVCRPVTPDCAACPVATECAARRAGEAQAYPVRAARRSVPVERVAIGVVEKGDRVLITRRAESGLLGGLWEFPGGKIREGEAPRDACRREIREEVSLEVEVGERISTVSHVYSHLKVEIEVFRCRWRRGSVTLNGPVDHRWILLEETQHYAFPKANHKFLSVLKETAGRTAAPRKRPGRLDATRRGR